MNVWLYSLGSVAIVSLISFAGAIALALDERRLRKLLFLLVALAAGALFGDVTIHILPEIFAGGETNAAALAMLAGILIFFSLEKFLHWRHSHQVDECEDPTHHELIQPVGHLNLIADGLHNLLDGAIIGASFLTAPAIGLTTTIAVILHEIPQEIGDLGVLLHAGFSRRRALLFNALSASLAIIGVVAALLVGAEIEQFTSEFLALAAGGFLYIAGSDLVPELHKTTDPRKSIAQFGAIIIGIILMLALTLIE
ncbi:MAG: ZIP family metal transporter [Candidatus Vogelbacteria bacterium]|nr:ZIP family metal transporter [Candidatus Vogelbacteria bacterium]